MALYRQVAPVVEAEQICLAEDRLPADVIRWESKMTDGSIGFIGTGAGLVHVFDGDWILRGPLRRCDRETFARNYERMLGDA